MCGIAGMFGKAASRERVQRMVLALRRRGPDDAGVWVEDEKQVALGHTRLSIIDLSAAGHQPMISQDGNLAVVFNGEIYNYKELRAELEAQGAVFTSNSDTEVLLWGWKIWGDDTPAHLRGMFAFAVWSRLSDTVTLVRDRMGIKPLLWCQNASGFVFGSTLKALLNSGEVSPVLNEQGLFDFLTFGAVCQPRTMIRDVQSLSPGTMMSIRRSGERQVRVYWALERKVELTQSLAHLPYEAQVRETRRILEEACRYHMIADVPVGSFLSGGVDSTVITALMARQSRQPIKSFSIGFDNGPDLRNELGDARIAAKHIGCDHNEVVLSGAEVADNFDDFVDGIDQPSTDGLNTYWVSKVARQQVKVALSGLGGDELFAGYDFFGWFDTSQGEQRKSWLEHLLGYAYHIYPHDSLIRRGFLKVASPRERLAIIRRMLSDSAIRKTVAPGLSCVFANGHVQQYMAGLDIEDADPIAQATRYDCKNYLLNTLLRDADALSMAHGLEVRPILLDHHLVEHALALPAASKWRQGIGKAVMKDAAKDLLPADFFARKKMGFVLPIERWLDHELHGRFTEVLQDKVTAQFLSDGFISRLKRQGAGACGHKAAWGILVFLLWAKKQNIQTV